MTDVNDFTDYSEPCSCGHTRRQHWPDHCTGARARLDRGQLPEPTFIDEGNPLEWPTNWPPVDQAPTVDEPCRCKTFGLADPEPPEDDYS